MATEGMGDKMRDTMQFLDEQERQQGIRDQVRNEVIKITSRNGGVIKCEVLALGLTGRFSKDLGRGVFAEDIRNKDKAAIIKEITEAIIAKQTAGKVACACES